MYFQIYFQICSSSNLFSKFVPSPFFKLRLSLLCNMQNNENNYEGAEREEKKKNKKLISRAKQKLIIRKKGQKFSPLPLFPSLPTNIQFWSDLTPLLNVLQHSIPLVISEFSSTQLCTAFFFVNAHNIYYSHKFDKTNRKVNRLSPSYLL